MLGIMSRGYICPIVPKVLLPGGPSITGATELKPAIQGASLGPQLGKPTIQGAVAVVPTIQGATADPTPAAPNPPTITGGNLLVPIIQSGEED